MNNMEIVLQKITIEILIDMLTNYSKYIELSEDLGINQQYDELKKLRNYINYYDIDDMIDFLHNKLKKGC